MRRQLDNDDQERVQATAEGHLHLTEAAVRPRAMNVLMISALDVWALTGQGGAPSLFRTLEAYGRHGHQVDFVCPTVGANHHFGEPAGEPPAIEGVTFHTFRLPSARDVIGLRPGAAALDQ